MKILHTSDWHVGRRIRGRDRSQEHRSVLAETANLAAENAVDLTVVAGDIFDLSSPTAESEEIVWQALLDLAEVSPVVVVGGNHDNPRRLDAVAPLLQMGAISMVGSPRRPEQGGLLVLDDLGVKVAVLPFVSQRGIVKVEDLMGSDPDQHAGAYQERVRRVVGTLTGGMTTETVNVLVGHLTAYEAEPSGSERHTHVFGYAVSASAFPGHLSYVALGHLHRQQKVPHAAAVWYSGSPLQLDFGEVGDQKGVLLAEVAPGQPARVTSLPLTSGRRLATLRGTLDEVMAQADQVGDAYVKVELTEKARVGLADEVRSSLPDAVEVTLTSPSPPAGPETEQRQTLPPAEAFSRYLAEKGQEDERVEKLFAELLEEALT